MDKENKEFMLRWYDEVWNKGKESAIDEMFHPEGLAYGLGTEPLSGPIEFKQFYRSFKEAYSNVTVQVDKILVDGNYVTAMCTVNAIYNESGKPVSFKGVSITELRAGKIVTGWNHFDFLGLNLQIGKITSDQLM